MINAITNKSKYMEICQHDEHLSENRTLNDSYQLAQVLISVFLEPPTGRQKSFLVSDWLSNREMRQSLKSRYLLQASFTLETARRDNKFYEHS